MVGRAGVGVGEGSGVDAALDALGLRLVREAERVRRTNWLKTLAAVSTFGACPYSILDRAQSTGGPFGAKRGARKDGTFRRHNGGTVVGVPEAASRAGHRC